MQLPGPWQTHTAGRQVFCNALVRGGAQRAGAEFPCRRTLIWVGRRKVLRLRVVGNRERRAPDSLEGSTIRCHCGTIYELDWEDRRSQERPEPDRCDGPQMDQAAS